MSLRSRKLRNYAVAGGAVALTAAVAYAYQNDAYGRSKRYLTNLRSALQRYTDALATGGDICATLLRDLQQFLQSDTNDVPPSLQQVAKLLQSHEFANATSSTVSALYQGIVAAPRLASDVDPSTSNSASDSPRDHHHNHHHRPQQQQPGALDKILDALLSDRGHSLVSVAVSMGAKNMVAAYVDATARQQQQQRHPDSGPAPDATDKLFSFLSTSAGQQLAVMGVAAFASNGMRVYMDKSLDVNFYEDLFSAMAKPHHLEAVKQCIGIFARDVVAAYLQGGTNYSTVPIENANSMNENGSNNEQHGAGAVVSGGDGRDPVKDFQQTTDVTAADVSVLSAISLAPSPTSSSSTTSGIVGGIPAVAIEAVAGDKAPTTTAHDAANSGRRHQQQDDLDSDSLLHARKTPLSQRNSSTHKSYSGGQAGNAQWIAAVGKEWLAVSRNSDGRKMMAAAVGSATRGAVAGVSSAVVDRMNGTWWVVVCILSMLMAVMCQQVLRLGVGFLS